MLGRRRADTAIGCALFLLAGCSTQKVAPPPPPPPPRAEIVLSGGTIVSDAHPGATAVAVDAGRMVEIGSDDEVKSWIGEQTRVVSLAGRTVVPGLVDAHVHLAGVGASGSRWI